MKKRLLILLSLTVLLILSTFAVSAANVGTVSATGVSVSAGGTATITFSLSGCDLVKSGAVEITTDDDIEVQIGFWGLSSTIMASFMADKEKGAFTFANDTLISGNILTVTFKASETITPGAHAVGYTFTFRNDMGETFSVSSSVKLTVACAHAHTENVAEQPATCMADGYTAGVWCSDCETFISGHEVISSSTAHSFSEWVPGTPATCTEDGIYGYHHCSICDKNYDANGNVLNSLVQEELGHDFSTEWTIDVPATFDSTGSKSHHCSRCEATTDVTEIPILTASVALQNTTFSTAWGIDFTTQITAKQTFGEGAYFVLSWDGNVASLSDLVPASGVSVVPSGSLLTVSVDHAIADDEVLVTLTFTTSDELAVGEHRFLELVEDDANTATFTDLRIYEMGDVNMDGNVNSRDVTLIKQFTVKMIELNAAQQVYANVYVDAGVNSRDAVLITQKVVHMDVQLGDRVNVTFEGPDAEVTERSVRKGTDLTSIPEPPTGYLWSESEETYVLPDFTAIVDEKRVYAWKEN